jgi:hypothetical protein
MKEQKTMIELVRRYEGYPLSRFEQFSLGLMMVFFLTMSFLFFVLPGL